MRWTMIAGFRGTVGRISDIDGQDRRTAVGTIEKAPVVTTKTSFESSYISPADAPADKLNQRKMVKNAAWSS